MNKLNFQIKLSLSYLPLLIFLILAILLSMMSVSKYINLHSSIMDLGVFTQHLFQVKEHGEFSRAYFGHVHAMLPVYSWITSSSTYLLLVFQSVLLSLPVYWLHIRYNWLVVLAYILFFPLWFNALFDFHFDHLAVPVLISFFLLVQYRQVGLASIMAIALTFIKEIFALQTAMCGIYLIITMIKEHKFSVTNKHFTKNIKILMIGAGVFCFGVLYFFMVVTTLIPMTSGNDHIDLSSAYSYLGHNIEEVLLYVFFHPLEILVEIFTTPGKVVYIVALFGALLFIPLLNPAPLIVALPIFAISLLSRNEGYYALGHHYTAGLIGPMIFSFAGGISRAMIIWKAFGFYTKWFVPVLVIGLIIAHVALAPSPIGRLFWSDKVWSYNYQAYIHSERDSMIKKAIDDFIPTDSETVVSIQNTVNWDSLVQRRHFLLFPLGVDNRQQVPFFGNELWPPEVRWSGVKADFVVLDLKRPWFLIDKGCDWLYGKCTDENMAKRYLNWVAKSREVMNVIFEKDGFLIMKRKHK